MCGELHSVWRHPARAAPRAGRGRGGLDGGGDPGAIRTHDLLLRRKPLYPAELRGPWCAIIARIGGVRIMAGLATKEARAMQISLYTTARTSTLRGLASLDGILDKAVASAEARKFDPAVLLGARLVPDMFTLTRQVQIACDFCKGTMARLGGVENPKFEDTEASFGDLKARIAKTRAFVESVKESGFAGSEDRDL